MSVPRRHSAGARRVAPLAGRAGAVSIGVAALCLLLVPVLSTALPRLGAPDSSSWQHAVDTWAAAMAGEPYRLVTGHGFGAFGRDRVSGNLPAGVSTACRT